LGTDREQGLRVEDFMGINRQVAGEDLQDFFYTTIQNYWERKLGELQRRGGSALVTNTTVPTNISSMDNVFIVKDKSLGKTRIIKCKATADGTVSSIVGLSAQFTTNAAGFWGTTAIGITNAYIGCVNNGADKAIQIIATGFGVRAKVLEVTASLPVSGDTKYLEVTLTAAPTNNNIKVLEVYANTIYCYVGGVAKYRYVYVGAIDINAISSYPNTAILNFGPATLGADPGSGKQIGSTVATFTAASTGTGGGNFVAGKTYYVSVLSQWLRYDATEAKSKQLYWSTTVTPVTVGQGHDSIVVSKTAFGSANSLVCIGTHPQMLRPYFRLMPHTATWSTTFSSFDQFCGTGVVQVNRHDETLSEYIYKISDWATGYGYPTTAQDMFAKVVNDKWYPIHINNHSKVNNNSADYGDPNAGGMQSASVGARYSACNYSVDGNGMLIMVPRDNWVRDQATDSATIIYAAAFAATQPADATGITINGKTYEFNSTGGVSAGNIEVVVAGTADLTMAALVTAINANDTTVNATVDTANDVVTITSNTQGVPMTIYNGGTGITSTAYIINHTGQIHHNLVLTDGNVASMAALEVGTATPPKMSYLFAFKEQIVGGGGVYDAYNRGYFTQILSPLNWSAPGVPGTAQYVQVESGGEPINGFGRYSNTSGNDGPVDQLLITKRSGIWLLTDLPTYVAGSINNATLTQLSSKVGAANHDCILNTDIGTIMFSIDNCWLIRDTGEPSPMGHEISNLLLPEDPSKTVDATYWTAVYHHGHVKLSYSTGSSSVPNQELWLNIPKVKQLKGQPAWYGPHVGREIRHSVVEEQFSDTILEKRICVDSTNKRYYTADDPSVTTDFGTDLSFILETRDNPCGDPNTNKLFTRYYWKLKVDQSLTFTHTTTVLNQDGEVAEAVSRVAAPITGYVGGTYAAFLNCRAKVYQFFPTSRLRGETVRNKFAYTGPIHHSITAFTQFFKVEGRRVG
jgi:hypothetical protein